VYPRRSPAWVLGNHVGRSDPEPLSKPFSSLLAFGPWRSNASRKRKPVRCHRTTVSGVTRIKASFHADQN
jgi:hypothetical protein